MNSSQVLALLDDIAATPGKNDKQAMVTGGMQAELFKKVCEYAYNPFKTYGIRKRPDLIGENCGNEFDDGTFELLDALISRKLTGTAAIEAVRGELTALNKASSELLWRIIAKDLRAGFSESTINKACKGLIPDFPYMRCCLPKDAKLSTWPWASGAISQEKADGMFANINVEEGEIVTITSRQGTPFPIEAFDSLVSELTMRMPSGVQLHGELLVMSMNDGILPREIGNGILNSVANGGKFGLGEFPIYMVWDMIPLTAVVTKGKHEQPYSRRLARIITALKAVPGAYVKLIETRIVNSIEEAYAHAGDLMMKGKEGTVVKHPNAIWKDGTSKEQVKLKLEFEVDLVINAIMPGREGTKNEGRAGAFSCSSSCGGLVVDVTVKNEALRDRVDANPEEFIGKIIAVTANDIMKPSESNNLHSLFLPRMSEGSYRTDKTEADSLQRILDQKEAAIFGEKLKEAA